MDTIEAIIIIGGALRFVEETNEFIAYIKNIGLSKIGIVKTAYMKPVHLDKILAFYFARAKNSSPLLVVYSGHGGKNFWSINELEKYPYETLANHIATYRGSCIFINDCCYAMSVQKHLIQAKCAENISLIASSSKNKKGASILSHILKAWQKGNVFLPEMPTVDCHQAVLTLSDHFSDEERGINKLREQSDDFLANLFPEQVVPRRLEIRNLTYTEEYTYMGMFPDHVAAQAKRSGPFFDSVFFPKNTKLKNTRLDIVLPFME